MIAAPFVGREEALGQLDKALGAAAAGVSCVALIYGEAGIGKTRLCQQLRDAHSRRGGHVLLGRGSPEESTIAYGAIADTLRSSRRAEPRVWESARTRAGVLRAIVPEIGQAGQPGGGADRPVVFEALPDTIEEAARGDQAVLWVLDDMHWADDATWHFVGYAARRVAAGLRHPLLKESAYADVPPPRRSALHQELAGALSRDCPGGGSVQAVERIAFHLDRGGQPEAALAVLEEGAERAKQAGQAGRGATLCLAALGLARRHEQLAPRRPELEQQAIWAVFRARRWSELDSLIRDAWSRSGALRPPSGYRWRTSSASICSGPAP